MHRAGRAVETRGAEGEHPAVAGDDPVARVRGAGWRREGTAEVRGAVAPLRPRWRAGRCDRQRERVDAAGTVLRLPVTERHPTLHDQAPAATGTEVGNCGRVLLDPV